MSTVYKIAAMLGILGVYLLPGLVAGVRRHKHAFLILLLNLVLGWTVLGWVAAMIWSLVIPKTDPAAFAAAKDMQGYPGPTPQYATPGARYSPPPVRPAQNYAPAASPVSRGEAHHSHSVIGIMLQGAMIGGLAILLSHLAANGMKDVVQSWQDGHDKPVDTDKLRDALGPDHLKDIAKATGQTEDQVLETLATHLPAAAQTHFGK